MKESNDIKIFRTTCESCYIECGCYIRVKDGKAIEITGDREHPISKGALCIKGLSALKVEYSPDRILYPMMRTGERGEGRWKRISWDQALDYISEGLGEIKRKYGPESICVRCGIAYLFVTGHLMARSLGSPNVCSDVFLCEGAAIIAGGLAAGALFTAVKPGDFENSKYILIWGSNTAETHPIHWHGVVRARKNGAKVVVIDPMKTETAQRSDKWLRIKPGTDAALALGMLNYIVTEKLYDEKFVMDWTNAPLLVRTDNLQLLTEKDILQGGSPEKYVIWDATDAGAKTYDSKLDALKGLGGAIEGKYTVTTDRNVKIECKPAWQLLAEHLTKYPLEKVSRITDIPVKDIVEVAREYAEADGACMMDRLGIAHNENAVNASLAVILLVIATGNVDAKGGNLLPRKFHEKYTPRITFLQGKDWRLSPETELSKMIGAKEYPLLCGPDGLIGVCPDPYVFKAMSGESPDKKGIKAYILTAQNDLTSQADSETVAKAIKNLDLFAVQDFFMTPTAELADIVLPAAYWLEYDDITGDLCPRAVTIRQEAVKPLGECWPTNKFYIELTNLLERKGYLEKNLAPWRSYREYLDYRLRGTGYTFESLKEKGIVFADWRYRTYEDKGFNTPSKKAEIFPIKLRKYGYSVFPEYKDLDNASEEYPLILVGARVLMYFHSQHRNIPDLRKLAPAPMVEIHPSGAERFGIKDGDWIWIETPNGRITQKARITDEIHPKCVRAKSFWWYPEKPGPDHGCFESNFNVITSMDGPLDPIMGAPRLRGLACRIRKAEIHPNL